MLFPFNIAQNIGNAMARIFAANEADLPLPYVMPHAGLS